MSSHTGTDIACAEGTPILAAADGVITVANGLDSWGGSYGYYIQIDHGGGWKRYTPTVRPSASPPVSKYRRDKS